MMTTRVSSVRYHIAFSDSTQKMLCKTRFHDLASFVSVRTIFVTVLFYYTSMTIKVVDFFSFFLFLKNNEHSNYTRVIRQVVKVKRTNIPQVY